MGSLNGVEEKFERERDLLYDLVSFFLEHALRTPNAVR